MIPLVEIHLVSAKLTSGVLPFFSQSQYININPSLQRENQEANKKSPRSMAHDQHRARGRTYLDTYGVTASHAGTVLGFELEINILGPT